MPSDLHDYIHGVLETGDHGPYRIIEFETKELNSILELRSKEIGEGLFFSYLLSRINFFSRSYSW